MKIAPHARLPFLIQQTYRLDLMMEAGKDRLLFIRYPDIRLAHPDALYQKSDIAS